MAGQSVASAGLFLINAPLFRRGSDASSCNGSQLKPVRMRRGAASYCGAASVSSGPIARAALQHCEAGSRGLSAMSQ